MTHIPHSQLNQLLQETSKKVLVGGIYKHYKYPDRMYKVEKLAILESNEQVCVMYRDIHSSNAPSFVRDINSWQETVTWQGQTIPRFVLLTPPN